MKKHAIPILFFLVVATTSLSLKAAGIELQEHDARAQGRVLAVRAMLNNAAILFFNPAGIAYLEGLALSAGDTMVFPTFSYSDPNGQNPKASTVNPVVAPAHFYATYSGRIHPGGRLGGGIGANFPFGLTIEWDDDFAGRHLLTKSRLLMPHFYAGLSYSPIPALSLGANLVVCPASVYMKQYLGREFAFTGDDGQPVDAYAEMGGRALGVGFSAGIQARPTDWLYLGLIYRRGMTLEMEGDAHFEFSNLADQPFHDQPVKTTFELPDIIALGIGTRIGRWYGEIDIDYTFWSVFREIPLDFPEDRTGQLSRSIPEYWKDGFTFRLGNEISITDSLQVVFGGGYDQNPAPDDYLSPMLPDSDRIFAALGAGYQFDFGLTLDMSYMFTFFEDRTVNGHACTQNDPQCFDSSGNFIEYTADGQLNWVGNTFPAHYQSYVQLLAVSVGFRF